MDDFPLHSCLVPSCSGICRHHDEAHGESDFDHLKVESEYEIVAEAARRGCEHCSFLSAVADRILLMTYDQASLTTQRAVWQHLDRTSCLAEQPRVTVKSFVVESSRVAQKQYLVSVRLMKNGDDIGMLKYQVGAEGISALPIPLLTGTDRELNAGSPNSISKIREWLERCSFHAACSQAPPARYPRRLLDVRNEVQLEQDHDFDGQYIALSYTWSNVRLPVSLGANISERLAAPLAWTDLPLTLQEAITMTRLLGFSYIWIDCICIIQDSAEDKASEIAKMGNIFGQAFLVLSTDAAQDPNSGFLDRSRYTRPFTVTVGSTTTPSTFVLREASTHNMDSFTALRAWCYQERILARRALIFSRYETMWECKAGCSCECGRDLDAKRNFWMHSNVTNILDLQSLDPGGPAQDRRVVGSKKFLRTTTYEYWLVSVERYSARRLSYLSDKLPAVNALAEAMQSINHDRYLAGLWEKDLLRGLRWSSRESRTFPLASIYKDYATRSAPSWSWASIPGFVFWHCKAEVNTVYLTSVLETSCTYLRLQGPASRVYVGKRTDETDCFDITTTQDELGCRIVPILGRDPWWTESIFDKLPICAVQLPDGDNELCTIQRAAQDVLKTADDCRGWCKLLWLTATCALVLCFSEEHPGCFERIGYARCRMPEEARDDVFTIY